MEDFKSLAINEKIIKAITEMGFEKPTAIQQETIPFLTQNSSDIVALAQTGTGKTAAFGIPLIQNIDNTKKNIQAIVLCPTRELCVQISNDIKEYSKYVPGINVCAIYGGASAERQISEIKRGVQIVVGTPGRVIDLIDRKALKLDSIETVVLDEADEMLNMGFKEDINQILSFTPTEKNVWLFSATMPTEIQAISRKYMKNPKEIVVGGKNQGAANIDHCYYIVHEREKYLALKRIVDSNPDIFAIVFCRTKMDTQNVADLLIKDGYNADSLHGDLSQAQRDHVMKRYRNRALQLLICTDVAARGIDVDNVTHVINYNIPEELESYTHRSGRTARAGKSGVSIILVNPRETGKIKVLERITGRKIEMKVIPSGREICEKQILALIKKIHKTTTSDESVDKYMPIALKEFDSVSKEDLIKKIVAIEFERLFSYYKDTPDINVHYEQGRIKPKKRLFVNLGKMDGLNEITLKNFVVETAAVEASLITQVDVKTSFSFLEINSDAAANTILTALTNQMYGNRKIGVELSEQRRRDDRFDGGESSGGSRYGRSSGGSSRYSGGGDRGGFGRSRERSSGGERGDRSSSSRRFGSGDRDSSRGGYKSERSGSGSSERGGRSQKFWSKK
ncbi:MAG: DEAD/DEAH box helicase [Bacteroidetes bacterium]|nr:DEAD/DEAH box helicase [Bacteroidota bacterium]